jgi:hypothetical protein
MSDTFHPVRGSLHFRLCCLFFFAPTAGCILYSDPINNPPEISIVQPERITRTAPAVFTANVSDPEEELATLRLGWLETSGACGPELVEKLKSGAVQAESSIDLPTHTLLANTHGSYCVAVLVTDRHGARAAAAVTVETVNLPPTIALDASVAGIATAVRPLWSTVRVAARGADDVSVLDPEGDKVTLAWSLTRPDGATVVPLPCPDAATKPEICFTADLSGDYTVSITATDIFGLVQTSESKLTVAPDAPPCLGQLEPNLPLLLRAADAPATFAILNVADDGDPFPRPTNRTSEIRFTWSVQQPGKPFGRLADYNAERFTLPGTYKTGDRVQVRVEVEDRVLRNLAASCSDSEPTCGVSPTCLQRYTWAVEYRL